jgi:hypothetical protein
MPVQVITRTNANPLRRSSLQHAFDGAVPQATQVGSGDNEFANDGVCMVLLDNSGASSRVVTFTGAASAAATAVASESVTLPANEAALIGPFPVYEFGELVTVVSAHAEVLALVIDKRGGQVITA